MADNQRDREGVVVAQFRDRSSLSRAVRELMGHGIPVDSIRVFVRSADGQLRQIPVEEGAGTLRGALLGAAAGAAVGVVLVVLVLAGVFGEPGVSPFGVRGIMGAVRTIVLSALAAVPMGALLGMGRWRISGRISDRELATGSAEVVVTSGELGSRAREILQRAGAARIE